MNRESSLRIDPSRSPSAKKRCAPSKGRIMQTYQAHTLLGQPVSPARLLAAEKKAESCKNIGRPLLPDDQGQPRVLFRAAATHPQQVSLMTVGPSNVTKSLPAQGIDKTSTYASKVGIGDARNPRSYEPRPCGLEGWQAARDRRNRALMAAIRSPECIQQNKARFDRLNEDSYHRQQYPGLEVPLPMIIARREEIKATFQFLRQSQPVPTRLTVRTNAAPLYLGQHMIFALPWDTTFDPANLESAKVPVWVELPNIHPSMEAFGPRLLQAIGEVLFTSLPNACFSCHQRGHLARNCPTKKSKKSQGEPLAGKNPAVEVDKDKEDNQTGRLPRQKGDPTKSKTAVEVQPILTNNMYSPLETEEETTHKTEETGGGQQKDKLPKLGHEVDNTAGVTHLVDATISTTSDGTGEALRQLDILMEENSETAKEKGKREQQNKIPHRKTKWTT
ncbi:hypothetical protein R1sor_002097 [Riccia sorocarpa]|uniref:CCHC-type domain-containing protein n=1 Tax=Riccia sorocarpa TaxID=122646 RepID=A0ABD3GXT5_9MARC